MIDVKGELRRVNEVPFKMTDKAWKEFIDKSYFIKCYKEMNQDLLRSTIEECVRIYQLVRIRRKMKILEDLSKEVQAHKSITAYKEKDENTITD